MDISFSVNLEGVKTLTIKIIPDDERNNYGTNNCIALTGLELYEKGKASNCTKICTWQRDNSPEQIVVLKYEGDGAYRIYFKDHSTKCTDVLRYTSPLKSGQKIELYEDNDDIGLQWGDVDYSNHSIRIRRTVGRLQKLDEQGKLISKTAGVPTTEIVARPPKSVTAQRTIPLFPQVWKDLMTYHDKQKDLLRAHGIFLSVTTPIFSTPAGITYEPRTYEDLFKRTLKAAAVPDINFHALRHTFATRALEAGMDIKVLSSILGHAQASTTLNLYAHSLPDHKKSSMEKMCSFYGTTLSNTEQVAPALMFKNTIPI